MLSSDYAVSKDMYRLRWDTRKQAVDLTNAFQNFRNDEELLDITLLCLSSTGRSVTMKAHQLILAAYSPVFKDMFNCMEEKKDPIIFMKGISHDNLSAILDFMYQGVVDIPKSVMNDFLADAQELQIKGLRGENDSGDYEDDTRNTKTSPKDITNLKTTSGFIPSSLEDELNEHDSFMESKLMDYENLTKEEEVAMLKRENEKLMAKLKMKAKPEKEKPEVSELELELMKQEHLNADRKYTDPMDPYEKIRVGQLFVKISKGSKFGKRKSLHRCNLCGKETTSDRRARHLRANHPEE